MFEGYNLKNYTIDEYHWRFSQLQISIRATRDFKAADSLTNYGRKIFSLNPFSVPQRYNENILATS